MQSLNIKITQILQKKRSWSQLLLALAWFFLATPCLVLGKPNITSIELETRAQQWHNLMTEANRIPEWDKVVLVNNFFNQVQNKADRAVWQRQEYWATPNELINANAGDCEDIAIAKFFTLIKMGVPEDRLFLIYAKFYNAQKKTIEGHIVLSYQKERGSEFFILDNIHKTIGMASDFGNLIPVFVFNQNEVWSAHGFGPSTNLSFNVDLLENWSDLKIRMALHN